MFWSFFSLHLFFLCASIFSSCWCFAMHINVIACITCKCCCFHVDYESPWSSLAFFFACYFQSIVWFLATFLQHFSLQDSIILLMAFFLFLINFLVAPVHVVVNFQYSWHFSWWLLSKFFHHFSPITLSVILFL